MPVNPLASPSLFPRCPSCGLYFIAGDDRFVRDAKAKFGWRVGHFDPHLPPDQWDALRSPGAAWCPRCGASIGDVFRGHDDRHLNYRRRPRKRDRRRSNR